MNETANTSSLPRSPFAERLRVKMAECNLSPSELASRLGVSRGEVLGWLEGESVLASIRSQLEAVLATSMDWLLYGISPSGNRNFAMSLRIEMASQKLSQSELARRLGVSRPAVRRWMDGTVPRRPKLKKLARELRIREDRFLAAPTDQPTRMNTETPHLETSGRIEQRMLALNFSQSELARRMETRQSTVKGWLEGSIPRARTLRELAKVLGVSDTWLLTGIEQALPANSHAVPALSGGESRFQSFLSNLPSATLLDMLEKQLCSEPAEWTSDLIIELRQRLAD